MPATKTQTPIPEAPMMRCRETYYCPAIDGELTVARVSYGKDASAEDVLEGRVSPVSAVLTQDGKDVGSEWHDGDSADAVYYERYALGGVRVAHGFVDRETRMIVQAG